ncbi:MAG: hypothetical protein RSB66_08535 [Clostridium sp.]
MKEVSEFFDEVASRYKGEPDINYGISWVIWRNSGADNSKVVWDILL